VHPKLFVSEAPSDIVDVEFEPVDRTPKKKKKRKQDDSTNLLETSLEAGDAQWNQVRVPFVQPSSVEGGTGEEYIDGKLAFTVDLDGQTYGIAVPYDDPVAVVFETSNEDGGEPNVQYYNPENYSSDEDTQELLEIMANQLRERLGEELTLRKTPKVLTVRGGLSKITDEWEQDIMTRPKAVEDLLKESEPHENSMQEFIDFMKSELGEEEFDKAWNEEPDEEFQEYMEFFESMDGMDETDEEGMESLFKSIADDVKEIEEKEKKGESADVLDEAKQFMVDTEGMSLKILSFNLPGGKAYSLVKLLEPYVLIGRYDTSVPIIDEEREAPVPELRFSLLAPEEEKLLIPRLEAVAKADLKAAGLTLKSPEENTKRP